MAQTATVYLFGEQEDIRGSITERDGVTFTLDSATVTITDSSETALTGRDGVAASVSDSLKQVWFHETFSTANGYAEGTRYTATFKATITRDTSTYTVKVVVPIYVSAAADE